MPSLTVAALGIAAAGVFVALAYLRRWQWTGLPASDGSGGENAVAQRPKTLWNWLELLGIPVALAALAFLLNDAQTQREQGRDDQRAAQQRKTAADVERENTLRTYLAQMSELMLVRRLLHSPPEADVREVARTATLTTVRRLDGERRGLVVRFLAEAQLLYRGKYNGPQVRMASADLSHADLAATDLSQANLRDVNLSSANLSHAHLVKAVLS